MGGVALMSFHGLLGLPPKQQPPLWQAVACIVLSVGLLFVTLGDRQRLPSELIAFGRPKLVRGEVVAPVAPIN